MISVTRGGWAAAAVAVVLVLSASIWWLGAGDGSLTGSAPVVLAPRIDRAPDATHEETNAAHTALAERLQANPERLDASGETATIEAPSAEAPDDALVDLRVVGRLLDERLTPVADALLTLQPTREARLPLGLPAHSWLEDPPWRLFPSTRSGDDGRFEFVSRDVPHDLVVDGAAPRGSRARQEFPAVLVDHPQFERLMLDCAGWTGGEVDLGDIELSPGVVLVGRVVDEHGTGLPGARIAIPRMASPPNDRWDDNWDRSRSSLHTDAVEGGQFELAGLWRGRNAIEVSHPGKTTLEQDLSLDIPGQHDAGDFVLASGGVISGRILNDQGQPLADVEVLARPQALSAIHGGEDTVLRDLRMRVFSSGQREERTRTDNDGRFVFDILPPVEFNVFVAADRREPVVERGVKPGGLPLELVLVDEATILVTVVDALTRAAITGATGSARRRSDPEGGEGTFSSMDPPLDVLDGHDAAAAAGLDPSTPGLLYVQTAGWLRNELTVSAPGHATRTVTLPGVEAPARLEQTLELVSAARLSGRAVGHAGEPLQGAQIVLTHDRPEGLADADKRAESGADGRFALDDLYAEQWTLSISLSGRASPEPLALTLVDEEQRDLGDVVLSAGGALTGVVVDPDGVPQPGVTVTAARRLDDSTDGKGLSAVSDLNGAFRYVDLAWGTYHLSCAPGADLIARVISEQTTEVVLQTRRPPRVHGRVVQAGMGLEGATVSVNSVVVFEDKQTATNAQGEYEQDTVPGEIVVVAEHDDHWTAAQTLDIDWDEVRLVDLAFSLGRISGVVRERPDTDEPDSMGTPIAGASVRLQLASDVQRHGSNLRRRGDTNDDGHFSFDFLPPGRWTLRVSHDDHVRADIQVITLATDEVRDDIAVELRKGAVIVGTVVMAGDGPPWSALNVSATPVGAKNASDSARIEDDGSYRLRGLPPGDHRLQVKRNRSFPAPPDADHVFAEITVTAERGQEVRVDLTAAPPGH